VILFSGLKSTCWQQYILKNLQLSNIPDFNYCFSKKVLFVFVAVSKQKLKISIYYFIDQVKRGTSNKNVAHRIRIQ
jgi:hypothetical protein